MKKPLFLVVLLSAFVLAPLVQAQDMTKAERKALKKEAKNMVKNLDEFRQLKEDKESAENRASALQDEIDRLQNKQRSQADEITRLQAELNVRNEKIRELEANGSNNPGGSQIPSKGVYFTVQLGAYRNIDLQGNGLVTNNDLNATTDDGLNKYVLGVFTDHSKASELRDYVRRMGVKDAWVVAYRDGVRVDVKDVLK
ncbi:hypothetical protein [Eisenibacter elegans]|uniref:hypothetical protein n=1 Tax=Eisenibacter elegans TaxID=997 RepID=UPI00042908EA|nr:hypothetical protein [Eisenibacter elegans]